MLFLGVFWFSSSASLLSSQMCFEFKKGWSQFIQICDTSWDFQPSFVLLILRLGTGDKGLAASRQTQGVERQTQRQLVLSLLSEGSRRDRETTNNLFWIRIWWLAVKRGQLIGVFLLTGGHSWEIHEWIHIFRCPRWNRFLVTEGSETNKVPASRRRRLGFLFQFFRFLRICW